MYDNKLVVAVRANGKILREHQDSVYVPFGCEYDLLIKNKNSVRALVRVEIDGTDVTEGISLIVPANGSVTLERFIKAGNMDSGNRFKFIERTTKIEDGPRGIKAEDGLIRVEFEFEQMPAQIRPVHHVYRSFHPPVFTAPTPWYGYAGTTLADAGGDTSTSNAGLLGSTRSMVGGSLSASSEAGGGTVNLMNASASVASAKAAILNDVGITVPGSVSDQKFEIGSRFPTDGQKHVMILKLLGKVGDSVVQEPITVKHKPKCITCGHTNKANAKFCSECGTGLTIV